MMGNEKPTEVKKPLRLQFKTLGALREMTTRVVNSEILTKEEARTFAELSEKVRTGWIAKNT